MLPWILLQGTTTVEILLDNGNFFAYSGTNKY